MRYPSLKFFNKLKFASIPLEELAYFAYALIYCQGPASVVSGEWYRTVDDLCSLKLAELQNEINRRLTNENNSEVLTHALAVLDGTAELVVNDNVWIDPPLPYRFIRQRAYRVALNEQTLVRYATPK